MAAIASTGLTALFEPQGQTDVDIVFVHGLQGHPEKTWLHEGAPETANPTTKSPFSLRTLFKHRGRSPGKDVLGNSPSRKQSVCWPRDLLPELCPTSRILTFGYDTVVTKAYSPADKGNIFSHAKDLLYGLDRIRPQGRSIIFVAHSLGGIIVKEALRRSESSTEPLIQDIINCTSAVVFMGTPHRGSDELASMADVVRSVAQTVLRMDANPAILRALGLDSPELELCRESFLTQWRVRDFVVKTFQESRGITGVNIGPFNGKVVPDVSSSLDDPREHAETIPADHMHMCRFSGPSDPGFRKVGVELQRLSRVRRAIENECEKCLAFPELLLRQRAIAKPMQNTCDWLFSSDTYRSWSSRAMSSTLGGFLWLKGKPGSGKSTLMKEAVSRMEQRGVDQPLVVPFFFNSRGSPLEKTSIGMMRGLCFHLLRQDEHLRNQLTNHYKLRSELGGWQPQEEELQQIVMAGFQTRSPASRRVVFFIDALDECDESSVRRTVHYLATLLEAAINADQRLDICLASRHYPTITAPRSVDIVVEHGNEHDISEYIARRIPYSVMPDSASVDTLRDMLLQKASGIFLWVVLVIDIVLRDIDEGKAGYEIEKSLADVPEDLAALFTDLMKTLRLKERAQSRALIFWVLLGTQAVPARGVEALQLFMNESLQSLSDVQPALQSLEQRSLVWDDNIERVRRMVRTISRGLIEVTGASQVQFIHATVREFFLTEGPDLFKAHYFVPIGHCMIIKTCLHALCVLQHSKAKQREQLDIFSETSHIDWLQLYSRSLPRHAVEARREVNLPNQLIHSVDRVCSILMRRPITDHATGPERACQDINRKGLSPSILGDRHLVALCVDTALLCNQILEALECGRAAHELPRADLALFATLIDSSHWKLGLSLPVAQEDPFGFQIRQSQQRDAMIRLQRVISNGAPVMSRDSEGNTAMHFAAWLGMLDLIDILCDHGHALDVQNNYELTPLHLAIQYGHLDAASRLLARGANPSIAGPQGYTGLHFSLESSSKPMVRLLLDSGASVSARDAFDRTPLHAGAKYGAARDVLTLLIQADADPLALDYDLVTPVMIATYYGLDSSSWSDPRQRWNGHKTNFTKMMESRIGHRPHSALDPTPASLFSPPPHPPDVKRQSGLLAAPGDGWPVSDHLPLGLDDGTNRRRSESPSGCI